MTLQYEVVRFLDDVQLILSSLGIESWIGKNDYGVPTLYIDKDLGVFQKYVGCIQIYKSQIIDMALEEERPVDMDLKHVKKIDGPFYEDTFQLSVDVPSNSYWTQVCDVGGFDGRSKE